MEADSINPVMMYWLYYLMLLSNMHGLLLLTLLSMQRDKSKHHRPTWRINKTLFKRAVVLFSGCCLILGSTEGTFYFYVFIFLLWYSTLSCCKIGSCMSSAFSSWGWGRKVELKWMYRPTWSPANLVQNQLIYEVTKSASLDEESNMK